MANQGLSHLLPYKFRNVISKPGCITNILQTPALEIVELSIPLPANLTGIIARPEGKSEVINISSDDYRKYDQIMRLLNGCDEASILWEVGIWAGRIEFNFCNRNVRTLKPDMNAISSKISFEAANCMEITLLAKAYDREPERRLICRYGEDAVWGKFAELTEFTSQRGVQSAIFYPKAQKQHLEKIAHL